MRSHKNAAAIALASGRLHVSQRTLYRYLDKVGLAAIRAEAAEYQTGELLTVKEVAKILKCSKSSVYRYAEAGWLPAKMIFGTLVRVRAEELQQIIAEAEYYHDLLLEAAAAPPHKNQGSRG
jgi:excisionase family DNA binding protein